MPGNSWNVVNAGAAGTLFYTGKIEMIQSGDIGTGWQLNDGTVSTTWEQWDMTSVIGSDVIAVILHVVIWGSGTYGAILNIHDYTTQGNPTYSNPSHQFLRVWGEPDATDGNRGVGATLIQPCAGSFPGALLYREHDATSWPVDYALMNIRGRIRP
tara:strand:+ start:5187 stop:5654 length:468 start_codon:yes stop_codon:yes gene_type:complete